MKHKFDKAKNLKIGAAKSSEKLQQAIQDNEGQVLITQGQIEWTFFVDDALTQLEANSQDKTLSQSVYSMYKKKVQNYVNYVK